MNSQPLANSTKLCALLHHEALRGMHNTTEPLQLDKRQSNKAKQFPVGRDTNTSVPFMNALTAPTVMALAMSGAAAEGGQGGPSPPNFSGGGEAPKIAGRLTSFEPYYNNINFYFSVNRVECAADSSRRRQLSRTHLSYCSTVSLASIHNQ